MRIDIRSILVAGTVICLVFLALSAFTWRRGRAEVDGSGFWFAGFCCFTVGIGLVALRGAIPDAVSIIVGNAVILAGVLLKVIGVFRYLGIRNAPLERAMAAALAAVVLCLAYFLYVAPSLAARMLAISLANVALGTIASYVLLFRAPREVRSHARIAASFYLSFALIYLYRVTVALTWSGGQSWLDSGNVAESYTMLAVMVILAGLAVSEMLLLHGKLESSLRVTAGELLAFNRELGSTQKEIMLTLSEIVEFRSKETASHVARVGEYARALSLFCGKDPAEAGLIGDAAPMHDIGKISIPDNVLNKVTGLDPGELEVIQSHTIVGYRLLNKSERPLIRLAALIALEHHEQWTGGGYPSGKSGESISFAGRVVCLCDVYDALAFARPYKEPWELPRILDYIRLQRGSMFDPSLVDTFLLHLDEFIRISKELGEAT